MTQAGRAGLSLEDVPRRSLATLRRRHKRDDQVSQALGLVLRRRRRGEELNVIFLWREREGAKAGSPSRGKDRTAAEKAAHARLVVAAREAKRAAKKKKG